MSVTVRPASAQDDPALVRIDRLTWSSVGTPAPTPDWSRRRTFFRDEAGPGGFLVAEIEGAVVGYVGLHQDSDLPTHSHVLTIDGLGVLPTVQGRGVGRALVDAAVEQASLRGARKVTLRVLAHNDVARRLYERCGFEVEGVLRGEFHLDGHDVDDMLMARRLAGD